MGSRRLLGACALVVSAIVAGCVKPAETTQCGEFTCGVNSVCSPDGTRCVGPDVVEACRGKAEGDACSYTGLDVGTCVGELCVAAGCGNGVVESQSNEVCDDGNRTAGDGCSADCRSTEACGDGIVDPFALEQCDCGDDPASLPLGCTGVNANTPNAQCRPITCAPSRCGDMIVDAPNESCDDGNNVAGDGCAADCSGRWTRMDSKTLARLHDVWAVSPTDAWAVGDGRIMRWDGTTWYRQAEIDSTVRNYSSVCGRSSQDVFVIGTQTLTSVVQVLRYQGAGSSGTWSPVILGDATYSWTMLHCRGNDVWLGGQHQVGAYFVGAFAYSATGATFGVGTSGDLQAPITSIWTSTDGDIYAADDTAFLHKRSSDGVYWPMQTQDGTGATPLVDARYIGGTTGNNVFVVGKTKPASHHGTSVGWNQLTGSDDLVPGLDVSAVPNGSTALIVGNSGSVLECSATSCAVSPTNIDQQLRGVWAIDATHAFIVGTFGTILY
jgi:cysteine-rich repeat protein